MTRSSRRRLNQGRPARSEIEAVERRATLFRLVDTCRSSAASRRTAVLWNKKYQGMWLRRFARLRAR